MRSHLAVENMLPEFFEPRVTLAVCDVAIEKVIVELRHIVSFYTYHYAALSLTFVSFGGSVTSWPVVTV